MSVSRWIKALTTWSPPPATRVEQEQALARAWTEIAEVFGVVGLPRRRVSVATLAPRARVRVQGDVIEIAEHVVLESWGDALASLLHGAVLSVAGQGVVGGRGRSFCVEANRIGRMLNAVHVRPRAHGDASPALWPVIKRAPRVETAGEVLARRVAKITAMLHERERCRGSKAAAFREVSHELSEALNEIVAIEAPPGAVVEMT